MTKTRDRDELLELLNRLVSGRITSAEQQRLEEFLKDDPEARHTYYAFMDLDRGLHDLNVGQPSSLPFPSASPPVTAPPRARFTWLGYTATAVLAVAGTLLFVVLFPGLLDSPSDPGPSYARKSVGEVPPPSDDTIRRAEGTSDVATLLFAEQCHWKSGGPVPVEGQPLGSGELHLLEGLALLRFHGGATALLSGDVRVDLESRGSMRLHHGRLNARAPEEAIGFTVRTPVSDVVDLGTEFALDVQRSGETKLEVIEGAVEYRKPEGRPGSGTLLEGGQAVRLNDKHVETAEQITPSAKSIEQLLREANPRAREDLMFVYEGFQYDPGSLALSEASGGWGWNGPWRVQHRPKPPATSGQDATMQIGFQQLNIPWPIRGGRAGMLELEPGSRSFVRPLAKPLSLKRNAVYYISMMMRETAGKNDDDTPAQREIARLTLRGSGSYWADRIGLGLHAGHSPHIEITDFNRFVGPRISGSQSMIWAAKIVARKHGEDQVFLRIYQEGDSLDIVEPADWSVVSQDLRSDALLDRVQIQSEGNTTRWFDEIRFGTSWRAVIPISKTTRIDDNSPKIGPAEDTSTITSSPN
jgi:ferric-dicitrate binding protein FerR (iron transport regulator)